MNTNIRASCVVRGALLLLFASTAAAQTLEQRVAKSPDGSVRFSFAAKPGVYGNGRNSISWDCDKGNCRNQVNGDWEDRDNWNSPCDSGPVRVAVQKTSGRITDLRVYVGGEWRPNTSATDLGTVSTKDAASYLLGLALRDESRASEKAIFPAVLADSVTVQIRGDSGGKPSGTVLGARSRVLSNTAFQFAEFDFSSDHGIRFEHEHSTARSGSGRR